MQCAFALARVPFGRRQVASFSSSPQKQSRQAGNRANHGGRSGLGLVNSNKAHPSDERDCSKHRTEYLTVRFKLCIESQFKVLLLVPMRCFVFGHREDPFRCLGQSLFVVAEQMWRGIGPWNY